MKKPADRQSWLALTAAALVCVTSAARAENARIVYYDVTGSNARALRQQMDAKGPMYGGKRFDAITEWYVKWNYRYRVAATGCGFTTVDVSVTGTIQLPRWIHGGNVSNALVKNWTRYLAALQSHEDGHYAHGENAAREIEALARSFRGYGDCAAMVSEFNDQARLIVDKYKALDAKYDHDTDHGRTQGARFP